MLALRRGHANCTGSICTVLSVRFLSNDFVCDFFVTSIEAARTCAFFQLRTRRASFGTNFGKFERNDES